MSPLDTIGGCINELECVNKDLAEFGYELYQDAGRLARLEKEQQRRLHVAMQHVSGSNKEQREAQAHAAVEATAEGLHEEIETLIERVERGKMRLRVLERRASSAQSALAGHRAEGRVIGADPQAVPYA